MIKLRYGNTNTFLINTKTGYLLVDTDFAGTINQFYRAIKELNIKIKDIEYILCTHYHPDHCGLVGNLQREGVKLLIVNNQESSIHFSDYIFERDKIPFIKIDSALTKLINSSTSREFLKSLGIDGEIITTNSHSEDGICLVLDDGSIIVGDIYPFEYINNIIDNNKLIDDWNKIKAKNPKKIYYAHQPEIIYN